MTGARRTLQRIGEVVTGLGIAIGAFVLVSYVREERHEPGGIVTMLLVMLGIGGPVVVVGLVIRTLARRSWSGPGSADT